MSPEPRKRPADDPDAPGHVQMARAHADEMDETGDNQAADLSKDAAADRVSDVAMLSAVNTLRRYLVENGYADPVAVDKARHDLRHPETGQFVPSSVASPAAAAFERYVNQGHPALVAGRAASRPTIASMCAVGRATDSPANPPVTPRPGTAWPGTGDLATGPVASAVSARGVPVHQVNSPAAPRPVGHAEIQATQNPGHPEATWPHSPLIAVVQHMDLTGQRATLGVSPVPVQPPIHTALTGAVLPGGARGYPKELT